MPIEKKADRLEPRHRPMIRTSGKARCSIALTARYGPRREHIVEYTDRLRHRLHQFVIKDVIGLAKSTVSRELRRNAPPSGRYSPLHAAEPISCAGGVKPYSRKIRR